MFDTPMREIIPFYKKGGKVSLVNKSIVKKKKMKQKQTQKQIVNIYNTAKPTTRKRVYKKVEKKEEQQQRMPVYYTQPSYTQYLPAPTITMPTRLPTMTPEAKLPTPAGLTTGFKTSKETKETGTDPDFDADFNNYMNDKQIYEQEQEEVRRKNKELVDFLSNGNNYVDEQQDAKHSVPLPRISYVDETLPNYNYGRERLPPPPPPKPPQQETKDPSEFDEYQEEPPEQLSLSSDLPSNKSYSKWTFDQLQRATINNGLYTITREPKKGQQKFDKDGNVVKKSEPGYNEATRQKTRAELIDALNEYDRLKIN